MEAEWGYEGFSDDYRSGKGRGSVMGGAKLNESQLLLEAEAICDRGAEQCAQCKEVLVKAGVAGAISCICHGQGCHMNPNKTSVSPKKQMSESYRRRNYRKY